MNITDYRLDFRLYQAALAQGQWQAYQHSSLLINQDEIEERYAHLWTHEAISDLTLKIEELSPQRETEKAALVNLLGFAQKKLLDAQTGELERELQRCQAQARLTWRDAQLTAVEALILIGKTERAHERRELEARRLETLRACDDLRIEVLSVKRESARTLGFKSGQQVNNAFTGAELLTFARAAENFLASTASVYQSLLRRIATQLNFDDAPLTYPDYQFWRQTLPAGKFGRVVQQAFHETLTGLGIRPAQQTNLRWVKGAFATNCFPVDAPREVVFVMGATESVAQAADFFYEGARAQHFAWSSVELADRYPEFIYANDCATNQSYGLLFNFLLADENWLREHGSFHREDEVRDAIGFYAFFHLHHVRRACASVLFAQMLNGNESFQSEQAGESYAGLYSEATGFIHHPAQYLSGVAELYKETMFLRAWGFAANLQEHLRSRYGRSWWTRRAAGDELIDLWNTASRYQVEELARQLGTGELNYELLAENLSQAINGAANK